MPTDAIKVPELALIGFLVLFFAVWGWRHGLDAVILAGLFVLVGRVTVDTLAVPIAAIVNMFYGLFKLATSGQFSGNNMFAVIRGDPNVVKPLLNMTDPNDAAMKILGTALFILIAIAGFRFALSKAGGKDTPIEQIFGLIGGAALGYICITFVIDRHITFPQALLVQPSETPQISVDAPLIVAVIMVLIVFGIQRSKPAPKKK
ncbi:MAG: hypothetical protein U0559_19210 [Anaerolineae bacterium]